MKSRDAERQMSNWLMDLRREFVRVASRRVNEGDVEDVVQEAMRVIVEKGIDRGADPVGTQPPLAWCFQVLRNTIGNHYQRERTRRRWTDGDSGMVDRSPNPLSLESMDSHTTLATIEAALVALGNTDSTCAGYLSRMADGDRAGDIADREGIERRAFYRRLYRCRQKLRDLLAKKGVVV
jgi:RNA polymerase sigma factor (sigma-70 family)